MAPNHISTQVGQSSSAELIALARSASPDAIGELYRAHGSSLFALAYRLTGSREDAEDVVHDVFLGLPEALRNYEERGSAGAWLKRITARVALTRLRSPHRRREVGPAELSELAAPSSSEPGSISGTALSRALDSLPEQFRHVFLLKEAEGYSHAEIAALLDISVPASQVRLHRAVKLLRSLLHPNS
jgi:RNA polymerase sigma-70 factor (ECF subfamily)